MISDKCAAAKVGYFGPERPQVCGVALSETGEHLGPFGFHLTIGSEVNLEV